MISPKKTAEAQSQPPPECYPPYLGLSSGRSLNGVLLVGRHFKGTAVGRQHGLDDGPAYPQPIHFIHTDN